MWGRASSPRKAEDGHAVRRLAGRRRRRRRRLLVAFFFLLLLLLGVAIYGTHQPPVRISQVTIVGADQSLADLASEAMQGSYLGLIPRDSIFFFPAGDIRAAILSAHPEIAALSISRSGLESLSIKVDERVPIARWCGSTYLPQTASSTPAAGCYLFDAQGFIYASTTASSTPVNPFSLFDSLPEGRLTSLTPVGETLPRANSLPAAFAFARRLAAIGSPVFAVVIRGDEVDDYLASGTRITYVLGQEEAAFTALISAHSGVNLADGSVEYVDLRFPGKVYLKKKSVTVPE